MESKFIVKLHGTIQQQQNKIALIFENWILNFHDQLVQRCKSDYFWSEEELVNTLETAIQGILTLHESGVYHGNITTQSIVFCEDNHVKLVDQFIFNKKYVLEDIQNIKLSEHFLEPQLILDIDNDEISNINIENDLWAIGMVFLQASTLEFSYELYDY